MSEYLIFAAFGLALLASKLIWSNMTKEKETNLEDVTNDYANPIELEDGKFAIPKPKDKFMKGVEYDEVRTDLIFKQLDYEKIKDTINKKENI